MESEKSISENSYPHGVIVEIKWEVHARLPDGKYAGHVTDTGQILFDIKANDKPLAVEYANSLIDLIKEKITNVGELKINEERLRRTRLSGTSESRDTHSKLFGMRGTIS